MIGFWPRASWMKYGCFLGMKAPSPPPSGRHPNDVTDAPKNQGGANYLSPALQLVSCSTQPERYFIWARPSPYPEGGYALKVGRVSRPL